MPVINFDFCREDDGLKTLNGSVTMPRDIGLSTLKVSGLGEWRHVPSNQVHFNEAAIAALKLKEKASNLSKVGLNYIGIKAKSHVLLAFNTRKGRTGEENVKKQLTKLFKALGATNVRFTA